VAVAVNPNPRAILNPLRETSIGDCGVVGDAGDGDGGGSGAAGLPHMLPII
jgi:hypothetical protein